MGDSGAAGGDALFNLASTIFDGHIPASVRPWFLGGRLIALSKDGDDPSLDETNRHRINSR